MPTFPDTPGIVKRTTTLLDIPCAVMRTTCYVKIIFFCLFTVRFMTLLVYIPRNGRMIGEQLICYQVDGSFCGIIMAFCSGTEENHKT